MSSRTRSSSSSLEDAGHDSSHERQVSVVTATGRRTKPLTAEEKVLRRRLQYKLHQRRHRAKQKETILELEQEVTALTETISRLQYEKQTLEKQSVFSSRGLRSGAPTKVAMEYLRVFEHGFNPHKSAMQEQFLRAVMDTTVGGPDYEGIDTLMVQWRRYSMFFLRTQYIPHNIVQVSVVDDMTVVVIDVTMNIQSTRDGLLVLYPNVNGREHIIQHMLSQPLVVPGSLRFTFDHRGVVTWFGTDMDFVAGLQRTLGSLEDVSTCMQDAQISFCTGQIQVSAEPKWAAAPRGCVHEEIELTC